MALNLAIESADRSVRWYLTPGQTSRYEIIVINQSGDEAAVCTMALDDPPGGGTFEPPRFSLRPRERKTVTLTFAETTQVPRDQRALISVRDTEGIVVASFEHGLISAGGTDCTVTLSWKEPIIDGDEVRGFAISCAIKSLSASPGMFALQFTPHPSLEFVDVAPIKLEPGQSVTVAVPVLWKRARKDTEGYNHPRSIEIGVAVSQGRRTGRLSWDTVERKLTSLKAPAPPPPPPPPPPSPAPPKQVSSDANGPVESKQIAALAQSAPSAPEDLTLFAVEESAPSDDAPAPEKIPPPPAVARAEAARSETIPPAEKAPAEKPPPTRRVVRAESAPAPEKTAPPRESAREEPHRDAPPPIPDAGAMNDDALMSLLVGKPVSPPSGWRSPGRDAPDASEAPPPSIFAKTPSSLAGVPPTPPPRPIEPPPPPPPAHEPPPPDEFVPPAPPRQFRQLPPLPLEEQVPQAARPQLPPDLSGVEVDPYDYEAPSEPVSFEGSIVGPPPSHSRTLEIEREHKALARRAAEESEQAPSALEGKLPVIVMAGTAVIAIALVAFFLIHPLAPAVRPQAVPSATVPPPVVIENVAPTMRPKPVAKPKTKVPKVAPSPAAHAPEQVVATSAPVPVTHKATHPPTHIASTQKPHPSVRRPSRYPRPKPTSIVMLAGIYARYGASGHAVRVIWGASSQASAEVQLSDERGSVISHTTVAGTRQNALLYLPRSYYGSVYIQVVSIGYQGERVTQSSYLPPYAP